MKLFEIFDAVLKSNLKIKSNSSDQMSAIFTVPNKEGKLIKYLALAYINKGVWEVAFVEADENERPKNIGNVMTGYGNAPLVYGAFAGFLERFAKEKNPDIVHISSGMNEPKKVRLYRMLAHKFAGKFGYEVTREFEEYYGQIDVLELKKK